MRNTKIRFKYITEDNIDLFVTLPNDLTMSDIIEELRDKEADIKNLEFTIKLMGGTVHGYEAGDTNELFSLEEIENKLYN